MTQAIVGGGQRAAAPVLVKRPARIGGSCCCRINAFKVGYNNCAYRITGRVSVIHVQIASSGVIYRISGNSTYKTATYKLLCHCLKLRPVPCRSVIKKGVISGVCSKSIIIAFHGQMHLPEISYPPCISCFLSCAIQTHQNHARQKADDGNDHEELDKGKPSPSFCGFVRTGCLKISLGFYHGFKKYTENWGWVKTFWFFGFINRAMGYLILSVAKSLRMPSAIYFFISA